MVKVSVVVPVYNVEKYLEECLDSLINQTLKDIEIICVNDGSTDKSLDILNNYAKKDKRIQIITQENKGLGAARNTGMKYAKGEYLNFIDSDDYLELSALEETYNISKEKELDFLMFRLINYDDKKDKHYQSGYYNMNRLAKSVKENVFNYKDLDSKTLFSIAVSACNKLYNREFIEKNSFTFPEGLAFEDNPFFWNIFLKAKRVFFYKKHLYNRRRREDSIMGLAGKNHMDTIKIRNMVCKIFVDNGIFDEHKKKLYHYKIISSYHRFINIQDIYKEDFFNLLKEDYLKMLDYKKYGDFNRTISNREKYVFQTCLNSKNYLKFELLCRNYDLVNKNKKLEERFEELNQELEESEKLNNELKNSNSWKITKPLRKFKKIFK